MITSNQLANRHATFDPFISILCQHIQFGNFLKHHTWAMNDYSKKRTKTQWANPVAANMIQSRVYMIFSGLNTILPLWSVSFLGILDMKQIWISGSIIFCCCPTLCLTCWVLVFCPTMFGCCQENVDFLPWQCRFSQQQAKIVGQQTKNQHLMP